MNKISFVIPMFDKFHLTRQLLDDIFAYSPSVDEILILDNGSVESSTQAGINFLLSMDTFPVKVARVEENVGFLKICNWGVPQAENENVVLISNDVRIESDLANEVRQKLTHHKILGGILYRESTGWNEFDGKIFPYLEGWLLSFTKWAWEDLGGFDERFVPCDYEDVDFSTDAINKRYELEQLTGNYRHLYSQTIGYTPERLEITQRNRELFRKKWIE